jgi:hypothetical protein
MAYAISVGISAELIKIFPKFMKAYVTTYPQLSDISRQLMLRSVVVRLTPVYRKRKIAYKYLAPIINERLASLDENGHWRNEKGQKPDDLLQWLIDAAPPNEKNLTRLVERMMAANFGALHSTIMVKQCLFPDFPNAFSKLMCALGPYGSHLQPCEGTR